jgi:hypothetical protein
MSKMTKSLKDVIARAETWPKPVQEEAAEILLAIEQGHIGSYTLTAEDRAALARSAEDVKAGRFAADAEVAEFFKRNRRG